MRTVLHAHKKQNRKERELISATRQRNHSVFAMTSRFGRVGQSSAESAGSTRDSLSRSTDCNVRQPKAYYAPRRFRERVRMEARRTFRGSLLRSVRDFRSRT